MQGRRSLSFALLFPLFDKGGTTLLFGKSNAGGVTWLLVCLGNYGTRFDGTRHNMGFMAADLLAARTYEVAFAANAVVIRRNSEMLGTLFDAFA